MTVTGDVGFISDSTKLTSESLKHFSDNEELSSHLHLSHPSTSSILTPGSNTPRNRDQRSEWLGDPEAILSVRRPRKPGLDQIHTARRSSSEQNVLGDFSSISSGSVMLTPRDRSNSFCSTKERKLQSAEGDECHIPNRRGGSLKERPTTNTEQGKYGTKPLVRSYSMLTKTSLTELQNRCGALGIGRSGSQEIKKMTACKEDSDSISNRNWRKTKHGSLKEKNRTSFQRNDTEPIIKQSLSRKSSADGEPIIKQSLSRKSSADGEPIIKQSLSRKSSADGEPIIKQSLSRKSSADGEPIIKQSLSRKSSADGEPIIKQSLSRKSSADGEPIIKQTLSKKSSTAGEQQGSKEAKSPKNLSRKPSKEMKKKMEKSENNQHRQDVRHHTVTYIYGDSANTSYDENSPRKSLSPNSKQSYRPKGLSANTSPDNSPRMSPLARDQPVFKY